MPQALRFMGLDIHRDYLVAAAVDAKQQVVYGPRRIPNSEVERWIVKELSPHDAVVLEMTTNTWTMVDLLRPHVESVTVVHPPHVKLITKAKVMTDKKASLALAKLHAAGLLPGVWVPTPYIRDLRGLVAQRRKLVTLGVQAKHRLRAVLHRHQIDPPEKLDLYSAAAKSWWESLPVSEVERFRVSCDLRAQAKRVEERLGEIAAKDERIPVLAQLPGMALITSVTTLAAIGEIERFPDARRLVGYAGLGTAVHESGQTSWHGRITKQGRRDLRHAMVEAAQAAARTHPHWKAVYARMEPKLGRNKTIVAIARKLLVAVWHVLTEQTGDRRADVVNVAKSLYKLAYRMGVRNLPEGMSALAFTRIQLDRLGLGAELTHLPWSGKHYKLPPSVRAGPEPGR
jgi:transposase